MAQTEPKTAKKKSKKRNKKDLPFWKRLLWAITHLSLGMIALILFVLALLYFLLFTNPGLRSIVWGAEKFVPEFKVEEVEGALLTDFRLYDVEYINPDLFVDFQAKKLELNLRLRCIPQAELCVDALGVQGARFALTDIAPSEETAVQEPTEPLRSVSIPFGIGVKISKLYLDQVDLDILGNKIAWREFETGAQMRFDSLTLAPTRFDGGRVELAPSAEESEAEPSPPNEPNTPIVLPEVWIPLSATVEDITVTDFKLINPDVQIDRANLVGFAEGNKVDIKNFDLAMPQIELNLVGNTELKGDYPLEVAANAKVKQDTSCRAVYQLKC